MSREQFKDDCPDCRPVLLDTTTGQPLPQDSAEMKAVMTVWGKTTLPERQAFHRVTCLNSREPSDLTIIKSLSAKMSQALSELQ